ncbi:MAG: hypothetical protein Q7V88_12465 [Actinomycetota bacterium]|nr:hypothetical protein [Actinomycetota bacterium]
MRAHLLTDVSGVLTSQQVGLPYRDARVPGPVDVIPVRHFWVGRPRCDELPDPADLGKVMLVTLSGEVTVGDGAAVAVTSHPGEVLVIDVGTPHSLQFHWQPETWVLLAITEPWVPPRDVEQVRRLGPDRRGRPLMTWVHDDLGMSRSQPIRWPFPLTTVPPVSEWARSNGAFVTRRDYGTEAFDEGRWHNGPRPQIGVTLNGRALNETGDGTVTEPRTGDLAFFDDVEGGGHVTRGLGDRWMLFVTVADESLRQVRER